MTKSPSRLPGWLALGTSLALWSLAPIVARYLAGHFTATEQCFFRYAAGALFIWLYLLIFVPAGKRGEPLSWKLLGLALGLNLAYQLSWIVAAYYILPTLIHLVLKLTIIVGALLAFIFEPEERELVRSRRFWLGTALGLASAIVLVAAGESHIVETVKPVTMGVGGYVLGVGLCIVAAISWPSYALCLKRLSRAAHPVFVFAHVSGATTIAFLVLLLAQGRSLVFWDRQPEVVAVVIVSGILLIAVAQTIYMVALKHLGMAMCMLASLATPLLTYALSHFFFKETFSWLQILATPPLLIGCALAIHRPKNNEAAADNQ